ncbi:hypothetical protein COT42_07845 [Candidatus Saganbacteria bacterium CG08_land_8_20_14_0_20_45_16]|uniref:Uncharacterized protein n=1 Tax=Candidatus Saganbacteria bacterium CG08_land_8_20_14_0_20_45_16 TaxID=2014293 RepID=A0A2H0XU57_UNCSA|nr:MAG: hypothetical protein COT42_07845 [Candidatus Saganbacteria bacterium CG08_land_8_20_14_0_20_45_16]
MLNNKYLHLTLVICNLTFCLAASQAIALPFRSNLNRGNDLYQKQAYPEAGQIYQKIIKQKPKDQKSQFNLGDSLYKDGQYEASQQLFTKLTAEATSQKLKQRSYYNLGNSLFKQEDYKNAIKSYEEALKLDPKDKDAKFNLELAKKKAAQPKQKQQQDKKNNQNKKDQQKKDQDKKKQKDQQNKNKPKNDQEQNQEKQPKPGQMSREDAQRLLNALENEAKHKEAKKGQGRGQGLGGKDW